MKKILILEKTGEELVSAGYTKCTLEKYNQYKADTTNYQTAISDGGKYYFKKKTASPPPPPTEPKDDSEKKDEKPYLKVKLPFKTTADSDAFRAWLLSKFPDYGDKTKMVSLSVDKAPSAYKTSNALKNAYNDKGAEYVKWVAGGGKVDPTTFAVTDGTYTPSNTTTTTTTTDVITVQNNKMKGCKGWFSGNPFKDLSDNDSIRNQLVGNFIKFYQEQTADITLGIPSGKCGVQPKQPREWIQEVFYDEDGQPMYAWQNPVVKNIAEKQTTWTSTSTGGEINRTTWFEKWNIERQKSKQVDRFKTIQTPNASLTTNSSVAKDLEGLKLAAGNARINPSRENCKVLFRQTKGYNNTDKVINSSIEVCRSKFPRLEIPTESLENKITGKLKLMKENKQLTEKVSDKLKTKKLEKISENFFKQNYRKFFDTYSKHMKSNNMISEATNDEFSKSFDVIFKGKEEEFKNRAIEYIISKLEINPSSPLAGEIKNELGKTPAKDLFTNEYDIPEAVTNAIEKTNSQTTDETGLKGIVSKSIRIDDKQVKQEVRKHIHDYVEGVKDDVKSLEQKLKSSIIQKV